MCNGGRIKGQPGVAMDDLVYVCTKIARQMDAAGIDKVHARAAVGVLLDAGCTWPAPAAPTITCQAWGALLYGPMYTRISGALLLAVKLVTALVMLAAGPGGGGRGDAGGRGRAPAAAARH